MRPLQTLRMRNWPRQQRNILQKKKKLWSTFAKKKSRVQEKSFLFKDPRNLKQKFEGTKNQFHATPVFFFNA